MADLSGICIRHEAKEMPLQVMPKDPALCAIFDGYGIETAVGPVFYADDPEVNVWGELKGFDRPGLVEKNLDGWRSIYSAAPCLPASLLRHIARSAGVHIYSDQDDIIYANKQMLGICVDEGGPRRISLPHRRDVYDLFNEDFVARDADSFVVELPAKHTGLYFWEAGGDCTPRSGDG